MAMVVMEGMDEPDVSQPGTNPLPQTEHIGLSDVIKFLRTHKSDLIILSRHKSAILVEVNQ
jgi:hypothetical protein